MKLNCANIRPCLCGGQASMVLDYRNNASGDNYIKCVKCGKRSSSHKDMTFAIVEWNTTSRFVGTDGNIEVEFESFVPVVELQALRDALAFNHQITEAGLANLDSLIERYRDGKIC